MKKFLYTIIALLLLPFMLVGAIIYLILNILQLSLRVILIGLDLIMLWIDVNIIRKIN